MIAHPRSKLEMQALIEHTLDCWEFAEQLAPGIFGREKGAKIVAYDRSQLTPRARRFVYFCLASPVTG